MNKSARSLRRWLIVSAVVLVSSGVGVNGFGRNGLVGSAFVQRALHAAISDDVLVL